MNMPFFAFLIFTISATFFRPGMGYTKFSGIKLYSNSTQHAYVLDKNIGIFETSPNGTLVNCELVEADSEQEKNDILKNANLNSIRAVNDDEYMHLLEQCEVLDARQINEIIKLRNPNLLQLNPKDTKFDFLIAEGTHWCGKGNNSKSYYDLGKNLEEDKCCRTHDFCPISVDPGKTNYGVRNSGEFELSDCACDDHFKKCLNKVRNSDADFVGEMYFNILQMKCVFMRTSDSIIRKAERFVSSVASLGKPENEGDSLFNNIFDSLLQGKK